ncbi:MAG: hypothetical protein ABL958_09595, partial [Bdellovibrionia bacterium]
GVFGRDRNAVGDTLLSQALFNLTIMHVAEFGGPCDRFSASNYRCLTAESDKEVMAPVLPVSFAPREAYRIRACEEAVNSNLAVTFALSQAGLTANSAADQTNLAKAVELFYADPVPQSVLTALADVHQSTANDGGGALDSWRFVLYTICASPGWQIP